MKLKSKSISWKYFMFHEMPLKLYFTKCSEKKLSVYPCLHTNFPNSNMMTSSKTQNNILKIILAPWYREWFKQRKYLRLMKVKYFAFPVEAFWFLNLMKTRPNMTNVTSKEVQSWHSRSIIHKMTGKISFKIYKLPLFMGKWPIFFKYQQNTNKVSKSIKSGQKSIRNLMLKKNTYLR